MTDKPAVPSWLSAARAGLDVFRDGALLLVLGMLLVLPETMDSILSRAGFTRASMFGFDWEKQIEEATQETEAAQKQVQALHTELGHYADAIEKLTPSIADATAKKAASGLAVDIRNAKSAAEQVGSQLGRNVAKQAELKSQFRSRIRPRVE